MDIRELIFPNNHWVRLGLYLVFILILGRFKSMFTARIFWAAFFLVPAVIILYGLATGRVQNAGTWWNTLSLVMGLGMGVLGLLVLFPQLAKLLPQPKPKKCKVCGQPADDVFIVDGGKAEGIYCRRHVMENFERAFKAFMYPFVVFHPEQERAGCATMYPYYALDEMVNKFHFEKQARDNVQRYIERISGKCNKCGENKAQVAYFRKGILTWAGSGPQLAKVNAVPQLLCLECTLKQITPALAANKEHYSDNGLFAPYKQAGVYVNTYL